MKKVFEFICKISESGKRLDIFLFEKINNKGINEKANAARGCKPDGIITLSKLYFLQSLASSPPVVIATILA